MAHILFSLIAVNNSEAISIDDWVNLLSGNDEASENHIINFINCMREASSPYKAFFFETKGTKASNRKEKQFEFVLVDAPRLYSFTIARSPAAGAFSEHFNDLAGSSSSASFPNLGRTSVLVSPKPQPSNPKKIYTDLASFIRNAPQNEIISLWKLALQEYRAWLNEKTESVWLSTSGLGVAWLHIRLDRRPKYYTFRPFQLES